MSDSPLITVVIPSYNSAGYIEETLHSLAIQTFKDFEVIVIDDHSTDDTLAIAEAAHKKMGLRGTVMRRPDDITKGVASCRNLGVKMAQGEWVSFLDSDDLFLQGCLAGTAGMIEKFGSTCFAYHHGVRQFEDGTNKTLNVPLTETDSVPKDMLQTLIHGNTITTSSVTLKKTVIDDIGGFDKSLHGVEDYMLWLRVSKRTKWFHSGEVWTEYRVRTLSLMGGREMRYYVEQNTLLIKTVITCNEFTPSEINIIESYLFDDLMEYYAGESISRRGFSDFFSGINELKRNGRKQLGFRLLKKHLKFLVLKKLSFIKKIVAEK